MGPTTTQNLVVKFDGESCGGVLVENASDDFPQQKWEAGGMTPCRNDPHFAANWHHGLN